MIYVWASLFVLAAFWLGRASAVERGRALALRTLRKITAEGRVNELQEDAAGAVIERLDPSAQEAARRVILAYREELPRAALRVAWQRNKDPK